MRLLPGCAPCKVKRAKNHLAALDLFLWVTYRNTRIVPFRTARSARPAGRLFAAGCATQSSRHRTGGISKTRLCRAGLGLRLLCRHG